jgi:hypothetical protein
VTLARRRRALSWARRAAAAKAAGRYFWGDAHIGPRRARPRRSLPARPSLPRLPRISSPPLVAVLARLVARPGRASRPQQQRVRPVALLLLLRLRPARVSGQPPSPCPRPRAGRSHVSAPLPPRGPCRRSRRRPSPPHGPSRARSGYRATKGQPAVLRQRQHCWLHAGRHQCSALWRRRRRLHSATYPDRTSGVATRDPPKDGSRLVHRRKGRPPLTGPAVRKGPQAWGNHTVVVSGWLRPRCFCAPSVLTTVQRHTLPAGDWRETLCWSQAAVLDTDSQYGPGWTLIPTGLTPAAMSYEHEERRRL